MGTYILKKELPYAKIGSVISFTENEFIIETEKNDDKKYYFKKDDIQYFIKNGWIKRIRPREWYLEVSENQVYVRDINLDRNGKPYQKLFSSGSEIIKVREVIE